VTLDADVIVIGTGFAGIGMAIALKRAKIERFLVLERAQDLGGTWRDNRYPGCACDIPSMLYSFSFARNRAWTRIYPQQDEIWTYLRHCAERFDILRHVRFGAEVTEARYDERSATWSVTTRDGATLTTRVLVAGMGGLSNPSIPQLPGLERFAGPRFHSAQWDHRVDVRGKRIAVIGTGASAIQFVPEIAPAAQHLTRARWPSANVWHSVSSRTRCRSPSCAAN
jgi:cation diffusion facilitator CzcD-associated flavoprotein CzcO